MFYGWVPDEKLTMAQSSDDETNIDETTSWPELAIGLYDRLTGRGAEITYDFEEMEVDVPNAVGEDVEHTTWRFDGNVTITTRERD
jgi:hypothetical protein